MTAPLAVIRHNGITYVCGWTTNGVDFRAAGCTHDTPREAIDHSESLTAPASRSLEHDPARYPIDGQADARASEALDLGRSSASRSSLPGGSDEATAPLPADSHQSASMSGTPPAR